MVIKIFGHYTMMLAKEVQDTCAIFYAISFTIENTGKFCPIGGHVVSPHSFPSIARQSLQVISSALNLLSH